MTVRAQMFRTPQFSPTDVWAVARAFLEMHYDSDVSRGMNAYNECRYCNGKIDWREDPEKIKHEPTCPVLVARDLLTGAPK